MRKIKGIFWRFWYFHVRNGCKRRLTVGGFEVEFHNYDIRFRTISRNWSMRVLASEYAFGYLCSAKDESVHGYALYMYSIATGICRDERLRKDIHIALETYAKRVEREGSDDE